MCILLLIERSLLLSSKLSFDVLNILFLLRRADTTLKEGIDWHCDRVSHCLMDTFHKSRGRSLRVPDLRSE